MVGEREQEVGEERPGSEEEGFAGRKLVQWMQKPDVSRQEWNKERKTEPH